MAHHAHRTARRTLWQHWVALEFRLFRARRWMSVHARPHTPFLVYTLITLILMAWMSLTLARLG